MKILGINRVELVVRDPDREADSLRELLGIDFNRSITEEHGVLSRISFEAGLELAGPTHTASVMEDLLARDGEGLLTIVFRVDSADEVVEMAKREGLTILANLDYSGEFSDYKSYRQVSISAERFPANASFTFAEYEEA